MPKQIENIIPSLEEITSDGQAAGLEAEASADPTPATSFDPSNIDVITQARTIDLLLTRLKEGELDLSPDFQRRSNLWNEANKSGLIESILLRIPIPSLYVSEDSHGNYTVVDGLQRICAIAHFVSVADLNKSVESSLNPLRLSELVSFKDLNGKSFADLPRPLQRRINETELTLHVIRAGTPPDVKFNIFSRINRGGLPLTAQEIRNAIYKGVWKKYIREFADSKEFKAATQGKIKGERMEDLELVLRFVALFSLPLGKNRPQDQNLDTFLNDFVEKGCNKWTENQWNEVRNAFIKAMTFSSKIFADKAFRKYSAPGETRSPINRGLFETESVALAKLTNEQLEKLAPLSEKVLDGFRQSLESDTAFKESMLYATGRGSSCNKRLEVMEKILKDLLCD